MACVTVTAITALGVSAAKQFIKHKEKKNNVESSTDNIKLSKKVAYLEYGLWGGSIILAAEHMIHGEIVPFPPFLTAMSNPESTAEMLKEMGTVGVGMTLTIILAWGIGLLCYKLIRNRKSNKVKVEVK